MKLRDRNEVFCGCHDAVLKQYKGDPTKQDLANNLIGPVHSLIAVSSYGEDLNKKDLKKQILRDATRDKEVLEKYEEFKSGFIGIFAWIAWPIFKMVLKWVIMFIIDNYLEV